jgi:hypothetical protein
MPLFKRTVGEIEVYAVVFGTGDVAISRAQWPDRPGFENLLYFVQDVEKPVDEWERPPYVPGQTSNDYNVETMPVMLEFNRIESLDNVVKTLQEMRVTMVEHFTHKDFHDPEEIRTLAAIPESTAAGRLLMAAMAKLTTESQQNAEPDDLLDRLNNLATKMFNI